MDVPMCHTSVPHHPQCISFICYRLVEQGVDTFNIIIHLMQISSLITITPLLITFTASQGFILCKGERRMKKLTQGIIESPLRILGFCAEG